MSEYEAGFDYPENAESLDEDTRNGIIHDILDEHFPEWEDIMEEYLEMNGFMSLQDCKEGFESEILAYLDPQWSDDRVALNEEWSNYTDMLCREGHIHELQYDNFPAWEDIAD